MFAPRNTSPESRADPIYEVSFCESDSEDSVRSSTDTDTDNDRNMPPTPSSLTSRPRSTPSASSSCTSSPPTLTPILNLKRSNPKGLSISLNYTPTHRPALSSVIPSTACASPHPPSKRHGSASLDSSAYMPGLPKTPSLPTASIGRSYNKSQRRPSLLSLITHPPGYGDVPMTPGSLSVASHPYTSIRIRGRGRVRSSTTSGSYSNTGIDPRSSRSAYPTFPTPFAPIDERSSVTFPTTSLSSSMSASGSLPTTASTPPLIETYTGDSLVRLEPYAFGPVEILPGIWLGSEESVWCWDVWAPNAPCVAVVNVAQEIENPFDVASFRNDYDRTTSGMVKSKTTITSHSAKLDQPTVEYAHLRWSHGETGLSSLPAFARLEDVLSISPFDGGNDSAPWRFWEAIRWIEHYRRTGTPVIIHCQCGVSRSATLSIAYVMLLAAAGLEPDLLGSIRTMQDAYDFVKKKSPWIGPNVSLVFQLVEFSRNVTTMLSAYLSMGNSAPRTEWPTLVEVESEDSWAKRRAEFGDEAESTEGAGQEARLLDEAMTVRARGKE